MNKKVIEFVINKKGDISIHAKEGFSGESCIAQTKDIELALGGDIIERKKTDDYYSPNPTEINTDLFGGSL